MFSSEIITPVHPVVDVRYRDPNVDHSRGERHV